MHGRITSISTNPKPWREWVWLYLGNCVFTAFLQLAYTSGLAVKFHGTTRLAFVLAIVSQAGFLNLFPALLTIWPLFCWQRRTLARILAGMMFTLLQVALLADVVIFRLFQQHFNSQIWDLLMTRSGREVLRIDAFSVEIAGAALFVLTGASLAFAVWIAPRLTRCRPRFGLAGLLIALLVERTAFATIDLSDNSAVPAVQATLPLYEPLTIKPLAKVFGYNRSEIYIPTNCTGVLQLPRCPLTLRPAALEPNILFIAIEGGRSDALDDKTMPNLSQLGRDSFHLARHFSTGNETRFSLFGLLYGVPGSYWYWALKQSVSPPWFDVLLQRDYEFRIMSSASLSYGGFDQTCFLKLTSAIKDRWDSPSLGWDRLMTEEFLSYLAGRTNRPAPLRPFFGFLFFNASHQPYEYPPEDSLYPGAKSGEINYLKLTVSPAGAEAWRGSYLNSLHYVDRQIGRVVKSLQDRGEYERTIIVVVGDHGEEFGELGHFGHGSSFNRFQTHTLAVLHLPGETPRIIDHLTSHVDLVPSVLTYMGITNALTDYTTGKPIQEHESQNWILMANREDKAMFDGDSITVFNRFGTSYLDLNYQELPEQDPRRTPSAKITEAMQQFRMFLK